MIDPLLVDEVIRCFRDSNVDYVSNVSPPTYPDGLDVEVFSLKASSPAPSGKDIVIMEGWVLGIMSKV